MVEILDKYGGWPVVKGENWSADSWEWMDANLNMSNDGLDDALLFALAILTDQKNSSTRILDVSFFAHKICTIKKLNSQLVSPFSA